MGINRTPSGTYKVRWYVDGRELSKTFTLKRDALAHEAAVRKARDAGHLTVEPMWHKVLRHQLDHTHEITEGSISPHGHFVYLLWGLADDKPIYVGLSSNVLARLGTHFNDAARRALITRVTLVRCYSAEDMQALEVKLIRFYNPELNIRDSVNGECVACGAPRVGTSLYCGDSCRVETRNANRRARSAPVPTTRLAAVSAAHRRAVQKLHPPAD